MLINVVNPSMRCKKIIWNSTWCASSLGYHDFIRFSKENPLYIFIYNSPTLADVVILSIKPYGIITMDWMH